MEQIISPNSAIPRKGRALVPGGRLTREVLRSTLNPLVHSNEAQRRYLRGSLTSVHETLLDYLTIALSTLKNTQALSPVHEYRTNLEMILNQHGEEFVCASRNVLRAHEADPCF
jgi:hypothetical protein